MAKPPKQISRGAAEMKHHARDEKGKSRQNKKRAAETEPAWTTSKRQVGQQGRRKDREQAAEQPAERGVCRTLQSDSAVDRFDWLLHRCRVRREKRRRNYRPDADGPRQHKCPR